MGSLKTIGFKAGGFGLIAMLALLPLLITALLGVAAVVPLFSKLTLSEDLCRKGTLAAQSELLNSMRQILQLSAHNEKLYQMEMRAIELVRGSMNPPALKAALALLQSIRASQTGVNAAQMSLKSLAEVRATTELFRTAGRVTESQRHLNSSYMTLLHFPERAQLYVQKIRKGSSDIYNPHPNFEELQKVAAGWTMNLLPHFRPWTKNFFPSLGNLKIQCTTGVEQKGEKLWEPAILGVKRQLRS
jgi:hypothetical protein